jgi:hypothetical protein
VSLQVIAVDLAAHPDIATVDDLAALKLLLLERDSDASTREAPQTVTVAGLPARVVDSTHKRTFDDGISIGGLSSAGDDRATELTWTDRDAFLIKGNWGYIVRITSADADLLRGHHADLSRVLESLKLNY